MWLVASCCIRPAACEKYQSTFYSHTWSRLDLAHLVSSVLLFLICSPENCNLFSKELVQHCHTFSVIFSITLLLEELVYIHFEYVIYTWNGRRLPAPQWLMLTEPLLNVMCLLISQCIAGHVTWCLQISSVQGIGHLGQPLWYLSLIP